MPKHVSTQNGKEDLKQLNKGVIDCLYLKWEWFVLIKNKFSFQLGIKFLSIKTLHMRVVLWLTGVWSSTSTYTGEVICDNLKKHNI